MRTPTWSPVGGRGPKAAEGTAGLPACACPAGAQVVKCQVKHCPSSRGKGAWQAWQRGGENLLAAGSGSPPWQLSRVTLPPSPHHFLLPGTGWKAVAPSTAKELMGEQRLKPSLQGAPMVGSRAGGSDILRSCPAQAVQGWLMQDEEDSGSSQGAARCQGRGWHWLHGAKPQLRPQQPRQAACLFPWIKKKEWGCVLGLAACRSWHMKGRAEPGAVAGLFIPVWDAPA